MLTDVAPTCRRAAAPPRPTRYRELLDLAADPGEFHNVIGRPEYVQRHLRLAETLEGILATALLP